MTINKKDLVLEVLIANLVPGAVVCTDIHLHQLNTPIKNYFKLDDNTIMPLNTEVALILYERLCETGNTKPYPMMNKKAIVMSGNDDDNRFQILYLYDHTWYTAIIRLIE